MAVAPNLLGWPPGIPMGSLLRAWGYGEGLLMSHLWVVAGPLQLPQREVFWGFSPASPPRFHRSHQ